MRIAAWRLTKPAHSATAFDGEGARLHAGRWNSKGTAVVYCSESPALAAIELLVHLEPMTTLPSYDLHRVEFEESHVEVVEAINLPNGWSSIPGPLALREIGDDWIASGDSLILEVPSVVAPYSSNYLINPAHPDADSLVKHDPEPFGIDERLTDEDR